MNKPKVLTIIGPTASGKTELSYRIAGALENKIGKNVEIISADSRQIYKHIPIATAQPPKEYLKKYEHHFINSLELTDEFNAGTFGKMARELMSSIIHKGAIPIVVGGSGLYLRSLIYGLFDIGDIIEEDLGKEKQYRIRKELVERYRSEGLEKLTDELKKVDEASIAHFDFITARRVIRALEVYQLTGLPLSVIKTRKIEINFDFEQIGIYIKREILCEKIYKRTDNMIEAGLIEEIRALKEKGYNYSQYNSLNTVGVKEVFDFLDDKIDYDKMVELIKQNTRRYAKRQMTWFKKDENIKWVNSDEEADNFVNNLIL